VAELQSENVEPSPSPLQDLLDVVREVARRDPVVRQAWTIFKEQTA
jgi:hypothetical protein